MDINHIPGRKEPLNVIMCTPRYFKIVDEKNVHMKGNLGNTDPELVKKQWKAIFDIYQHEADKGNIDSITAVEGTEDCEDMVFCANQSFPWILDNGKPVVVMSRMKHASRQREVQAFENFYRLKGYEILGPPGNSTLEGMGDLIPMPGKSMIFGGYGHRTEYDTLEALRQTLGTDLVTLELVSDEFYHLDTCFIPLDQHSVMIVPGAFNAEGMEKIHSYFHEVIEIPHPEAAAGFALNAHVVNGHNYKFAVIQKDNPFTVKELESKGYKVYQVNTSEFMKSGGSVFCMKMMYY